MNKKQLALHIELTDEQYTALMAESIDAILDTDQIKTAISELILKHMDQYLSSNNSIITNILNPNGYYVSENKKRIDITKHIFESAVDDYTKTISIAVKKYMSDILESVDSDKLMRAVLHEVLVSSTVDALRSSVEKDVTAIFNDICKTQGELGRIANRIGECVHY